MRKSQTTTKHIFLFLLLYIEKFIIFCWKTYLEKLLYYYICITAFFTWRVVGDAVMKHQRHIDMHWPCRRRTLTQNIWQYTRYFNVDFDSNGFFFLFYIYFREIPLIQKKQKHLLSKIFDSPHTSKRIIYCGIVFQTMYISICTQRSK